MVGAFGEVQVMDWGMAKVLQRGGAAEDRRATRRPADRSAIKTVRTESGGLMSVAGSVMGTPAYMAPEQARGEVEDLDERADVFGLGAILCEILTGLPPYAGETTDEIYRKAKAGALEDAAKRIDASGADSELIQLAKKCLAADRRDRPRDAGVVADEIGKYLASFEARARASELAAAEASAKAKGERKARRLTVALAATAILAICLGTGGYLWRERERQTRLEETRVAVGNVLQEVALLKGQAKVAGENATAKWSEALAALGRAEALLKGRESDVETANRVERLREELEEGARKAQVLAERAARNQAFSTRLADVRIQRNLQGESMAAIDPEHETNDYSVPRLAGARTPRNPRREDRASIDPEDTSKNYAAAFKDFGFDVENLEVEDAAKKLRAYSIRVDIAAALDDWAFSEIQTSGLEISAWKELIEREDGLWKRLIKLARKVDPDPWRNKFRGSLLAADWEALHTLSRSLDEADLPPATVVSFGHTLNIIGETEGAVRTFHPDPGARVFHVFLDGNRVLRNHDTVSVGFRRADVREFPVQVSDGLLDITFKTVAGVSFVAGIEIERLE